MAIKFEPPSKEELAARGVVEVGDAPTSLPDDSEKAPAKKSRKKKE